MGTSMGSPAEPRSETVGVDGVQVHVLSAGTVAALADRYLQVLDALGLDRLDLVGTSLGGWPAAEIALRAPERVARLVLVDPAGLRPQTPAAP
jgi:pimeloyl-ACP methyl ester carboxylesterase